MNEVVLKLTATEFNALIGLTDLALKAGGRNCVNAFNLVDAKLREAAASVQPQEGGKKKREAVDPFED